MRRAKRQPDEPAGKTPVALAGDITAGLKTFIVNPQVTVIVEDFTPSSDEQALYDDVSEYLRRHDDPLLTLVYRKLLASSSFALAPTLEKLAESGTGINAVDVGF